MTDANFANAPPAKSVDGLLAVPIDIEDISAELIFDGATTTSVGDATLNFTVGPQDGNPIFDPSTDDNGGLARRDPLSSNEAQAS